MTPDQSLYHYYTCCFLDDIEKDPKSIDDISNKEMREYIYNYILENDTYLQIIPLELFESLRNCYLDDEYVFDQIDNLNAIPYAFLILNEDLKFDELAINFIKNLFEQIDTDFVLQQYELLSFMKGIISIYKAIPYEEIEQLCEDYFPDMLITLNFDDCITALINHGIMTVRAVDKYTMYILDKRDLDLSDLILDYYGLNLFEPYDYSKEFIIAYGNRDYFNLNDEAKAVKAFIDEYLETSHFFDEMPTELLNSLNEHQINTFIEAKHLTSIEHLTKLVHGYLHIEDILYNILPYEENEVTQTAIKIFSNYINTLPCASMGGAPYGEISEDDDIEIEPSISLNLKESKDFMNILSAVCGHANQADPTLYDDFDLEYLDEECYDPFLKPSIEYIINNPDSLQEFVEINPYMSDERKQDVLEFKNALTDWCMFLGINQNHFFFIDQQGNKYATKMLDENVILYIFNTRKKYIYLPLALVNYRDHLIAINLCKDLMNYKVPNKVKNTFKKLRNNTTLDINNIDDFNFKL